VRREGHLRVAAAYAGRFDDAGAAIGHYRAVASDPAASDAERRVATSGAALAQARLEGVGASLAELERGRMGRSSLATQLRAKRIGDVGLWIALPWLALFLALGIGWGGWRGLARPLLGRALSPKRLAVGAFVLAPPAILMALYDWRTGGRFTVLCSAMAVLVVAAAIFGVGVRASGAAAARLRVLSMLAAFATLAAAFVALERSHLLADVLASLERTP
jgi:hypothetical protein